MRTFLNLIASEPDIAAVPIMIDIQLLLGIVLWVIRYNPMQVSFGATPPVVWEHITTMILAVSVAHIAWSRVKKSDSSAAKFRIGTIGFVVAALFIAMGVIRLTGSLV